MTTPTGSGLYRAEMCPPCCALPQVASDSPDARRGHICHGFLEMVPKVGPDKALAQVPDEFRATCAVIETDGLPLDPEVYRQEVTYAFDLATGQARVLGVGLGRDYTGAKSSEAVGTIDVDGILGADTDLPGPLDLYDYKFDGFDSTAPKPEVNPQLLFAALCASRVTGIPGARLTLIHIRPDGTHWKESAEVGAFELDDFEDRLRTIIGKVRDAEGLVARGLTPNVRQGSWCRYCPAAASCPAVLGLIRAAAGEPERVLALQPGDTAESLARTITPDIAATAYERMRKVEAALKVAKSALYLYAQEHPFEIGEGYAYGPCRGEAKEYDGRVTRSVVLELHGPEAADLACDYSTSEAAIERAVRPTWEVQLADYNAKRDEAKAAGKKLKDVGLEKPTLSGLKKAALEAVEKAGGIKRETKITTKEYRVGREVGVLPATPRPTPAPGLEAPQEFPPADVIRTCPAHGQHRGEVCPACAPAPATEEPALIPRLAASGRTDSGRSVNIYDV